MNYNRDFMEAEGQRLQDMRQKWIEQRIEMGGDSDVIRFIADVLFHGGNGVTAEDSVETIRCLFEAGYCYYFAKMLEDAFPGGQVCLCYPYGHVVYVFGGVAYDIGGVSDAEYEMYIPFYELGDATADFKHVPGIICDISKDELNAIGEHCKKYDKYINAISAYDQEIVDRSRAVCEEVTETQYIPYKRSYIIEKDRLTKNLRDGYITKKQFNDFMDQYCQELGLSYPLILRMEREKALSNKVQTNKQPILRREDHCAESKIDLNQYKGLILAMASTIANEEHVGSLTMQEASDLYRRLKYENYCIKHRIAFEDMTEDDYANAYEEGLSNTQRMEL